MKPEAKSKSKSIRNKLQIKAKSTQNQAEEPENASRRAAAPRDRPARPAESLAAWSPRAMQRERGRVP